jgi:hypothetical protein
VGWGLLAGSALVVWLWERRAVRLRPPARLAALKGGVKASSDGALYDWVGRGSGTALRWMDYWTCTASTKLPLVRKAPFVECIPGTPYGRRSCSHGMCLRRVRCVCELFSSLYADRVGEVKTEGSVDFCTMKGRFRTLFQLKSTKFKPCQMS